MCVFMSSNYMSVLCFIPAFKCVLKCVHISEVLLHAGLELFIKLFLKFLLTDNYTVILVFKFFIVIKLRAIRGCLASV